MEHCTHFTIASLIKGLLNEWCFFSSQFFLGMDIASSPMLANAQIANVEIIVTIMWSLLTKSRQYRIQEPCQNRIF